MWFNHKTVIFGRSKPSAKPGVNGSRKQNFTADLSRDQLADIGMASGDSAMNPNAASGAFIFESRFTGYRGNAFA